ncbi:unnamed protein product [Plutella xylostella]|uniref:(diamondback moth) hypothetical protein n=1 Tax=Plutella xylostella TaxID=51655 RepID=A0A8S4DV70_PLUXY|nr:unnamed protein product [Plutella xylostella]
MDGGGQVDVVYTDFEKAFDRVDHTILLTKLERLGIHVLDMSLLYDIVRNVVDSLDLVRRVAYCTPRRRTRHTPLFQVPFCSTNYAANSVLTRLTRTYNKLFANIDIFNYDLQLYTGVTPESFNAAVTEINDNLEIISKWVKSFGLLLNPSKSQAIVLGSSRMLSKIDWTAVSRIQYDQSDIPYVSAVKNLGVIMDSTLSWIPQVDAVSKKMFASFHSLKRLQNFLPFNTKITLAQSLLLPILDYADGELTISSDMERLMESLFMDKVPESWSKLAYPSLLGLAAWFADLCLRLTELENWSGDFVLPPAVWLAGFFNPQSFLTAIMQQTARKNEWPLDKMCLNCDVTKKTKHEFTSAPREGAYIHGLYMEGARWDAGGGGVVEARMMELFPLLPVVYVKAVTQDKQDTRNVYECPVYKTRLRGPTFVWTFNLKTKDKPTRWCLAGVALLLGV